MNITSSKVLLLLAAIVLAHDAQALNGPASIPTNRLDAGSISTSSFSVKFSQAPLRIYTLQAGENIVGAISSGKVLANDNFISLSRRYAVGFDELVAANQEQDTWLPVVGSMVTLPLRFILPGRVSGKPELFLSQGSETVVINLPEKRLYHVQRGQVHTYPVGIGRERWKTPVLTSHISEKIADPEWVPPPSIVAEAKSQNKTLPKVYLPGPQNPMGEFALRLGRSRYLIHGTNRPAGVGKRVSHGCVRLLPEHISVFFETVSLHSQVVIVNEPVKAGWLENILYVEVHPP